jgi:RNA polymerase sigma factor (sigma-70 family)
VVPLIRGGSRGLIFGLVRRRSGRCDIRKTRLGVDRRLRKALKGLMDPDLERRRRAMESFVRTTFERFIRCLYRYLGNEVECEDVLENVYADIWEDPSRLRDVADEKELIRTVYLYYMRKRLREVYRRLNRHLNLSQEGLQMLVAPGLGVLETLSEEELRQTVRRMLGKLQARERRAIELWMEGMSMRAIANELKTTVGAVKMLKFRTIMKLKKEFGGLDIED